jgi:hypothetical protein
MNVLIDTNITIPAIEPDRFLKLFEKDKEEDEKPAQ